MEQLLDDTSLATAAALLLAAGTVVASLQLLRSRAGENPRANPDGPQWLLGAGGYLLLLALAARGLTIRGWPLARRYEILLLSAASLALFYAFGFHGEHSALAGVCAGLVATPMLVLNLLFTPSGVREPQPLPPLLGGTWFPVHVLATVVSYGGLLLAGSAGILGLVSGGSAESSGIPRQLDEVAYIGLSWGYPWLTLGMIAGAVWSWESWGVFWSWNSKEVLSLSTWALCALAFHTRRLKGWRGRPHRVVLGLVLLVLLLTLLVSPRLAQQAVPGIEYVF